VELYRELDVAAAEDSFKVAIQLDPNYATVHHYYGALLAMTGRFQEAIAEKKQAAILDPLSLINKAALAQVLSLARQYDAADEQIKRIFEIDPHFAKAHESLRDIYSRRGMYKEAVREYKVSEANGGEKLWSALGYAYALSGDKQDALKMLSRLQALEMRSGGAAYDLAVVEIGLGNKDEALVWLQKAYQEHNDDGLLWLKVFPIFDPLRAEARFQDLLRRMMLGS
jgi:tetratricopeptide (TPR) repeat protein